jgi:FMN phosphatase YigB (HAD superfamily)
MKKKTTRHLIPNKIVFLFDIDNTLLDRDGFVADLKIYLEKELGVAGAQCYWSIFDRLWSELGYADYFGALQGYRIKKRHDLRFFEVSNFLINYPFFNHLYPNSLEVIEHVKKWGRAVILSDGDAVFQPHKIDRSGLDGAVQGNVLIYVHKERELDDVVKRFPADHYVMVDDKLSILTAIKKIWGPRVTTIFVRQGCFALDPKILAAYPSADININRIGDLLDLDESEIFKAGRSLGKSGFQPLRRH